MVDVVWFIFDSDKNVHYLFVVHNVATIDATKTRVPRNVSNTIEHLEIG